MHQHASKIKGFFGNSTTEGDQEALCWTMTAGRDWYGHLILDHESHFGDFLELWPQSVEASQDPTIFFERRDGMSEQRFR